MQHSRIGDCAKWSALVVTIMSSFASAAGHFTDYQGCSGLFSDSLGSPSHSSGSSSNSNDSLSPSGSPSNSSASPDHYPASPNNFDGSTAHFPNSPNNFPASPTNFDGIVRSPNNQPTVDKDVSPFGPLEPISPREFVQYAAEAATFLNEYLEGVRERRVRPAVQPGYIRQLLPSQAPEEPDSWRQVLHDIQRVILPGLTHWQSPRFLGHFPAGASMATALGELLSAGLAPVGFSWEVCPAATELESLVLDWLARLMELPGHFLNGAPGPGGGVIQGSASESTLVALLAAKERTVRRLLGEWPGQDPAQIKTRLVAYTSDQANSSVEKAGLLASVPMRLLASDAQGRLRADVLRRAVDEDLAKGLVPSYVVATLGTTPTCACDPLREIGEVCRSQNIWLHVDGAYAGAALLCEEFRHFADGMELADSFCFNPHKWMLVNFDCSAMWVKDSGDLVKAFSVERVYLHDQKEGLVPDYRHWQIQLGRRFRALKLWLVLRLHGARGLRAHIRLHTALAQRLAALAARDSRFAVPSAAFGLVCLRLKGPESLTAKLLDALEAAGRIFVVSGLAEGRLCVRVCVCSRFTSLEDIDFAWSEIKTQATAVLAAHGTVEAASATVIPSPTTSAPSPTAGATDPSPFNPLSPAAIASNAVDTFNSPEFCVPTSSATSALPVPNVQELRETPSAL